MVPTQSERRSKEASWRRRHIANGGAEVRKALSVDRECGESLERETCSQLGRDGMDSCHAQG